MPQPSLVMIALVAAFTLNSSAVYFSTAVKGASSGTETILKGSLGSEVSVILNETLAVEVLADMALCLFVCGKRRGEEGSPEGSVCYLAGWKNMKNRSKQRTAM